MPTNKELQKAIQKVSSEDITILPAELPMNNRQAFINRMGEKVTNGDLTVYDVGKELTLTDNQIRYCINYVTGETMGHAQKSAIAAYDLDPEDKTDRRVAANYASIMNKPTHPASTLMQIILYGQGLNPASLDSQLNFVCNQNYDLKAKVLALREANTLNGRNNQKQVNVTVTHRMDYSGLAKKDLEKLIEIARKAKIKDDGTD